MRRVTIVEPDGKKWKRWKSGGEKKRDKHIAEVAQGSKASLTEYYKGQKDIYRNRDGLFKGKCAFCEQSIISNQHGDIEHYRPKAAVQDENWQPVIRDINGTRTEHPGYYWLAYDWQNLLLACISCNDVAIGREWGKGNRFPVVGMHRWSHDDLSDEQPLLLNPIVDDPSEHMALDGPSGILSYLTERGRVTIEILGLNKRDLPAKRAQAYDDATSKFNFNIGTKLFSDDADLLKQLKNLMDIEFRDFGSAWCQGIKDSAAEAVRKSTVVAQGIQG